MPGEEDDLDPNTPPAVPPVTPPAGPPAPPATPPVPPVAPPAPPARAGEDPAIKARIADQAQRLLSKELKKLYGTDDAAEIERIRADQQTRLEQHQQMVAEQEARKREQMTEVDRLKTDIANLTEECTQLKAKLAKVEGDKVAVQQDAMLRGIAINYVSPKWVKYSLTEFRDYVLSLPAAEQKRLDDRRINKWFADFAKKEPTCALEQPKPAEPPAAPPAAAPATPPVAPPARKPLPANPRPPGLGPKPNAPPASADPFAGLTPKPGLPNSMNKEQLRAYAKANNLPYPG